MCIPTVYGVPFAIDGSNRYVYCKGNDKNANVQGKIEGGIWGMYTQE